MSPAEQFVAMQHSVETKRAYATDLAAWQDFIGDQTLTVDLALAFREHLATTLKPSSAQRRWSVVRTYHRWLISLGELERSPFDVIKGPKGRGLRTPEVPDDMDVDAIVVEADKDPKHAAIVALLLNGLRAAEVGKLTVGDFHWADTNLSECYIKVIGKGEKERLVPLTDEARAAVLRYWGTRPGVDVDEPAILNQYGEPLTNQAVWHIVDDLARAAKVKGVHPHSFRHHYATRLLRAGVSPLHIRDLLGHTSVATTQIYVTLDLRDLFEAARKDPRNPKVDGLKVVREEQTA